MAVWITLRAAFAAAQVAPAWLQWAAFGVLVALTPVCLARLAGISKKTQTWVNTGAVVVWAFCLGGAPFSTLPADFTLPVYGAVLLPLYTFAVPLLNMD